MKLFKKRLYKELFYLDNYVNIINDIELQGSKKTLFEKYKRGFYNINKQGVTDIIFTDRKDIFSENRKVLGLDLILKNKKLNIAFTLDGYPFRCPNVVFNNDPNIYCKMYRYIKYFDINDCLCRSSIIYNNTWSGCFSLSDIILEYITYYQQYISRVEDKYNCNLYICYCKLGFYLPISDFL